jgi:hypothetical protein
MGVRLLASVNPATSTTPLAGASLPMALPSIQRTPAGSDTAISASASPAYPLRNPPMSPKPLHELYARPRKAVLQHYTEQVVRLSPTYPRAPPTSSLKLTSQARASAASADTGPALGAALGLPHCQRTHPLHLSDRARQAAPFARLQHTHVIGSRRLLDRNDCAGCLQPWSLACFESHAAGNHVLRHQLPRPSAQSSSGCGSPVCRQVHTVGVLTGRGQWSSSDMLAADIRCRRRGACCSRLALPPQGFP